MFLFVGCWLLPVLLLVVLSSCFLLLSCFPLLLSLVCCGCVHSCMCGTLTCGICSLVMCPIRYPFVWRGIVYSTRTLLPCTLCGVALLTTCVRGIVMCGVCGTVVCGIRLPASCSHKCMVLTRACLRRIDSHSFRSGFAKKHQKIALTLLHSLFIELCSFVAVSLQPCFSQLPKLPPSRGAWNRSVACAAYHMSCAVFVLVYTLGGLCCLPTKQEYV